MTHFVKLFFVIAFSYAAYGADKPLAQFESNRLTYHLLQQQHKDVVVDLLADPEVGKTYWTGGKKNKKWVQSRVSDCIRANTSYLMGAKLENCEKFRWAIFEKGQFVGVAGINKGSEFVVAVSPQHHGRGLGTEIEKKIVDQLFTYTSIQKIIHETDPDNWGSRRIAEKCGFSLKYEDNTYVPTVGYVLDRQEWQQKR